MIKNYCHTSKSKLVGPCGPCSFINLIGLRGSARLEGELAELGRMKPFHASDFTSFLIWAEKYGYNVEAYVTSKKISATMFRVMCKYEKIPIKKRSSMIKAAIARHDAIVKRNNGKIHLLKGNPLRKIKELLGNGYGVVFRIATKWVGTYTGHVRVVYKKRGGKYFVKDSAKGLLTLTERQMQRDLDKLKIIRYSPQLIAYRKNS